LAMISIRMFALLFLFWRFGYAFYVLGIMGNNCDLPLQLS
jgi:hypothetical protein